jgi:hypothetical protein
VANKYLKILMEMGVDDMNCELNAVFIFGVKLIKNRFQHI